MMEPTSFSGAALLRNLPKETLLVVIEQLCSKLESVKARLADSEERNRLLQRKLPQFLTTSIRSMLHCKPENVMEDHHEASPSHEDIFLHTDSPFTNSPTPIPIEPHFPPSSEHLPFVNGNAMVAASLNSTPSNVLNFLSSLMQTRASDFPIDANIRRKRKLAPQKNLSPEQHPSPQIVDEEVSGASTVSVNGGDEQTDEPSQRTDGSFLDPIPLEWSSTTLPALPPLKSADSVSRSSDMETEDILNSVVCEDIGDDALLSEESLHEMDEQIRKSMSIRKSHYWHVYHESEGWTKATCALMSCLFTRSQMAQSTVLGRGGQPSGNGMEVRYRLPVKSVHYIVATINKRFNVAPSKVRARMAQKCKDARRAARKASEVASVSEEQRPAESNLPNAFRTCAVLPSTSIG